MSFIGIYLLTLLAAVLLVGCLNPNGKSLVAVCGTVALSVVSSVPAVGALMGQTFACDFAGSFFTGPVRVIIDPLSAWFVLVINFTMITSVLYGRQYMQAYADRRSALSLHWMCYLLVHAGLTSVCAMHNSIGFLVAWEVMAFSSFVLVIFEGDKVRTIRAGINYLIQSHIGVALLTVAFVWVAMVSGTYDFSGIGQFVATQSKAACFGLMMLFFVGFAFKAGFVPFHTWLPHAHPAAPSHVSGMMSGVLIKIGIYGIVRMLILINVNYLAVGYFILAISVITGVYGVMLAIVQHNLKKLLAYHSVENIGIIGIGIGVGCLGLGYENQMLAIVGFAGGLLHVLNHSLFKSLLFYGAGNVYQATHTMEIEHFGGLIKRMPQTALLFLLASLAICGLPPFNGFVSEFIIYNGLFSGINASFSTASVLMFVAAMAGLALIGGLAIMCFTKAFGIVFLGTPRHEFHNEPAEFGKARLLPMYMVGILIVAIGLFPQYFVGAIRSVLGQMVGADVLQTVLPLCCGAMTWISWYMLGFVVLVALVYGLRSLCARRLPVAEGDTWGCGYLAPTPKIQYTASSFVRSYRRLAKPLLNIRKRAVDVEGIFPTDAAYSTEALDHTETGLIHRPLRVFRLMLSKLSFLQNGRLQNYILYGLLFIVVVLGVPFICHIIRVFINYLNTLL
ncbi:MAG: hypothetical protein IKZ99_08325 [Salinivirgaceae bacterium]|nr:hypothetical protein [Salinivirgaceae bacterium]